MRIGEGVLETSFLEAMPTDEKRFKGGDLDLPLLSNALLDPDVALELKRLPIVLVFVPTFDPVRRVSDDDGVLDPNKPVPGGAWVDGSEPF